MERLRWNERKAEFGELLGKTLSGVEQQGDEILFFTTEDGERFMLHHDQDCCESVTIEDVAGDLDDLIGHPILLAEVVEHDNADPESVEVSEEDRRYRESFTWTFYKIATIKGAVTIRWYGESNGYYSESVDFERLPSEEVPA